MESELAARLVRAAPAPPPQALRPLPPRPLLQGALCSALAAGLLRLLRLAPPCPSPLRTALLARLRAACCPRPARLPRHALPAPPSPPRPPALHAFLSTRLPALRPEGGVCEDDLSLAQALLNVDPHDPRLERLADKLLSCGGSDEAVTDLLTRLWSKEIFTCNSLNDRLAAKAAPEMERILLDAAYDVITSEETHTLEVSSTQVINLIKRASNSPTSFRLCCKILNCLFIISDYNLSLQSFIEAFVCEIKKNASPNTFISLYDDEVQSIVILLNCDLGDEICDVLVDNTLELLETLRSDSNDLYIMLLSHYSIWFDRIVAQN